MTPSELVCSKGHADVVVARWKVGVWPDKFARTGTPRFYFVGDDLGQGLFEGDEPVPRDRPIVEQMEAEKEGRIRQSLVFECSKCSKHVQIRGEKWRLVQQECAKLGVSRLELADLERILTTS